MMSHMAPAARLRRGSSEPMTARPNVSGFGMRAR
jgi:hypothetical protein